MSTCELLKEKENEKSPFFLWNNRRCLSARECTELCWSAERGGIACMFKMYRRDAFSETLNRIFGQVKQCLTVSLV